MKNLIILKLGGSAITEKDKNIPIVRTRVVRRIASELSKAIKESNSSLILIHGTGSFGHPPAKKYSLDRGIKADPTKMGLSITKRSDYKLNGLLWKILEEYELPIITIPPSAITISSNRKIQWMDLKAIKYFLTINRIPMLFGDEVPDTKLGYSISSSDLIAYYLASKLKPDLLLFASDVDGIYDQNPKTHLKAKRIETIKIANLPKLKKTIVQYNLSDVSGEMAGKIGFLFNFRLSKRTTIRIFSGLIKDQVYKALNNQKVGTIITV